MRSGRCEPVFQQTVSGLESLAFVTGLASVWLALRLHVANWPLGLLGVACFAALFVEAYSANSLFPGAPRRLFRGLTITAL